MPVMNDSADYAYIKAFFKKHHSYYDLVTVPFRVVEKKVAALIPPGPQVKVLDVATGTARQAFALARRGNTVTGLDLSPDMLAVARSKNTYPNVTLVEGDAAALPFEDAGFDVTHIAFALHDMPPAMRPRVLAEMRRVTRPGGTVFVVDYFLPSRGLRRWFGYRFIRTIDSKYYPSFAVIDLAALVRGAGITVVAETHTFFGMVTILRGTV
jgi:ubiquinone/menaquinone biosynthesis C-methylase UbiE